MFVRNPYNYDAVVASDECGVDCSGDVPVTQQQFAEECDINTIVRRFGLTGELPENVRVPVSGDFTGVVDFQTAMQAVRRAEADFMELPGHIRARFENDPQRLMAFLENVKNRDEAISLGLVSKPAEVTRDVVKAVDELAAKLVPKV